MFEIFPAHILDNSIHTAILVGLLVSWLFTERLGWGFVGFVVPGYLAAIGIVQPISLFATVIEAILTYGVVWALGSGIPRLRLWAPVFGRERFLLFILVSVPIRLVIEGSLAGLLQPIFWSMLDAPGWTGGQFFSIGIVLVPLLANAFWKSGLSAGLWEVFVKAGLSALVLVYVLEPLTNFSLGSFRLTFDTLALDFLYMPRFYIILVMTAVLSTHLSLRLGWDFSGILIPSLLAVVVFTPTKLFWTVVEILVLVLGFHLMLRLPLIRSLDLSGPRQILSMYLLSYVLKIVVAYVAMSAQIDVYNIDIYGFGYLLTSLIALRCYQKSVIRVMVPVGLTTAGGFVLGSLVAVVLNVVTPAIERRAPRLVVEVSDLELDIVRSWPSIRKGAPERSAAQQRTSALLTFRELSQGGDLSLAVMRWQQQGMQLSWSLRGDGTRCLGARAQRLSVEEPSGIPAMWWCGGSGPVLLVPQPRTAPDSLWIAAWLAQHGQFSGVVVFGSDDGTLPRTAASTLRDLMGRRPVISISSTREPTFHLLPRSSGQDLMAAVQDVIPMLEVDFTANVSDPIWGALQPTDAVLRASIPALETMMVSQQTRVEPPGSDQTGTLDSAVEDSAVEDGAVEDGAAEDGVGEEPSWPALLSERVVSRVQHTYHSSSLEERYVYQDYLLRQLLRGASVASGAIPERYQYLSRLLDARLHEVTLPDGRRSWLLLDGASPRGWGSWFLPLGVERGPVILAPASIEEPGTAGVGLGLLGALDGRALWVSGVARDATLDGEGWSMSGFSALAPEALGVLTAVRESGPDPSMVIVRERAHLNAAREGLVLSDGQEVLLPARGAALDASLRGLGGAPYAVSAEDRLTRDTAVRLPRILDVLIEDRLTLMWLSRNLLSGADGHPDKPGRRAWYAQHGVPVRDGALPEPVGAVVADTVGLSLMVEHLTTGLAVPLFRTPGRVEVFDDGVQLSLQSTHEGVVCQAQALGRAGCWGAP